MKKSLIFSLLIFFSLFLFKIIVEPINGRYFVCSQNLDYDKDFISFSVSGCNYSKLVFLAMKPLLLFPYSSLNLVSSIILFLAAGIICLLLFKISKKLDLHVNYVLISFSLLFFILLDTFSIFNMILILLGLLFFIKDSKKSFIFCGLFLGIAGLFKPYSILFLGALFLSFNIYYSNILKMKFTFNKDKIKKSLFMILGLILSIPLYFYDKFYVSGIFYTSLSRIISLSMFNNINFYLVLFIVLLAFFKKNKSVLDIALIIFFIIIAKSLFYEAASLRFITDALPLLSFVVAYYLVHTRLKIPIIIILMVIFSMQFEPIVHNLVFSKATQLLNNQLFVLNESDNFIIDGANDFLFNLKYNSSVTLTDKWLFQHLLLNPELLNNQNITNNFTNLFDFEKIDVIVSNQELFGNKLGEITPPDFKYKVAVFNYGHNCASCIHMVYVLFKNPDDASDFSSKINDYWAINKDQLCSSNPKVYDELNNEYLSKNKLPACNNSFNVVNFEKMIVFLSLLLFYIFCFIRLIEKNNGSNN